jgi:hypothetical protein
LSSLSKKCLKIGALTIGTKFIFAPITIDLISSYNYLHCLRLFHTEICPFFNGSAILEVRMTSLPEDLTLLKDTVLLGVIWDYKIL